MFKQQNTLKKLLPGVYVHPQTLGAAVLCTAGHTRIIGRKCEEGVVKDNGHVDPCSLNDQIGIFSVNAITVMHQVKASLPGWWQSMLNV